MAELKSFYPFSPPRFPMEGSGGECKGNGGSGAGDGGGKEAAMAVILGAGPKTNTIFHL